MTCIKLSTGKWAGGTGAQGRNKSSPPRDHALVPLSLPYGPHHRDETIVCSVCQVGPAGTDPRFSSLLPKSSLPTTQSRAAPVTFPGPSTEPTHAAAPPSDATATETASMASSSAVEPGSRLSDRGALPRLGFVGGG